MSEEKPNSAQPVPPVPPVPPVAVATPPVVGTTASTTPVETFDGRAQFVIIQPVSPTLAKLKDFFAQNVDLNVTETTSAAEAVHVAKLLKPCVIIASITQNAEIVKLLQMAQALKTELKRSIVKCVIVSKINEIKIIKQFEKFGIQEIIIEPIPDRQLQFKLNLQVKANKAARKKQKEIEMKKLTSDKVVATDDVTIKEGVAAGPKGPGVKEAEATEGGEDTWLFKGAKPAKKGPKWAFRLEGPDPKEGEWQKMPDTVEGESQWRFMPKNPEEAKKGGWQYEGDEPSSDGKGGWNFRGVNPDLSFVDADGKKKESKVSTDDEGNIVTTKDSEAALKKDADRQDQIKKEKEAAASKSELDKTLDPKKIAIEKNAGARAKAPEDDEKNEDVNSDKNTNKLSDQNLSNKDKAQKNNKKTDVDDVAEAPSKSVSKDEKSQDIQNKIGEDDAPADFNNKLADSKTEESKKRRDKIFEDMSSDDDGDDDGDDDKAKNVEDKNFLKNKKEPKGDGIKSDIEDDVEDTVKNEESTPSISAKAKLDEIKKEIDAVQSNKAKTLPEKQLEIAALKDKIKKEITSAKEKSKSEAKATAEEEAGTADRLHSRNFIKKKKPGESSKNAVDDDDNAKQNKDENGTIEEDEDDDELDNLGGESLSKKNKKERKFGQATGTAVDLDEDQESSDSITSDKSKNDNRDDDVDTADEAQGESRSQITDDSGSQKKNKWGGKGSGAEDEADGEDRLDIERQNANTYKASTSESEMKQYPLEHFGSPDGTWESAGIDTRKTDGLKVFLFIEPQVKMKQIPDVTRLPVYWISYERPARSTKLSAWLFKEYEPESVVEFDLLPLYAQQLLLGYSSSVDKKNNNSEVNNDDSSSKDESETDVPLADESKINSRRDKKNKREEEEKENRKVEIEKVRREQEAHAANSKKVEDAPVDVDNGFFKETETSGLDAALDVGATEPTPVDNEASSADVVVEQPDQVVPIKRPIRTREMNFILTMSEMIMNPLNNVDSGLETFCAKLSEGFDGASVTILHQSSVGKIVVAYTRAGSDSLTFKAGSELDVASIPLVDGILKEGGIKVTQEDGKVTQYCVGLSQTQGGYLGFVLVHGTVTALDKQNVDVAYLRVVVPSIRGFLLSAVKTTRTLVA